MTSTLISRQAHRLKLAVVALMIAGAALASGLLAAPAAHAEDPSPAPGVQQIIVGDQLQIWTDRASYRVGDWISICYRVPAPGQIRITDHQGASVRTIKQGFDNGTGDCFWGQVTPPTGQECLRIRYWFPYGGSTTKQTCFHVFPYWGYPY
jgi:hypothetical protein